MKVYYIAATPFRMQEDNQNYKKTINYLKFKVGQKNFYTTENPILISENAADPHEVIRLVKTSEKRMRDADVVIADLTIPSAGVGFRIAAALMEKKPVLVLRDKNVKLDKYAYDPSTSGAHKNIVSREYSNIEDLTHIIDDFLEEAKSKIDTKFILIIPAEIDRYLNWASDFRRMHKAQVVRKAIETVMQKDKDWKDYQKSRETGV